MGCKIFIAFGHSGYERDLELAENIPEIDLIVGGHSHTFLFSGFIWFIYGPWSPFTHSTTNKNQGEPPSDDQPKGDYPTVVTQPSGRRVPVVQAYAYTKYLGYLKVNVDEEVHQIKK